MKPEAALSLSIAVLSLAFVMTKEAKAKTPKNPPAAPVSSVATTQPDAARMVTAQAGLVKPIDARKIQAGEQFQMVLNDKVQLKNGPALPRGTVLIGTASAGDSETGGASRLTLRFTQAQLKGGKTVPIKATIVGIFPASSMERNDRAIWNPNSLKTDQTGVVPGLALHSNVLDSDSGVFESTKGDAVKLPLGSWIALAIEAQQDSQQETNGPTGAA